MEAHALNQAGVGQGSLSDVFVCEGHPTLPLVLDGKTIKRVRGRYRLTQVYGIYADYARYLSLLVRCILSNIIGPKLGANTPTPKHSVL